MGRVVLASLATLAASTDFLAVISDHGSGSTNVSQRLKKLGPCVLSVGELFSTQERLVDSGGKKGHLLAGWHGLAPARWARTLDTDAR